MKKIFLLLATFHLGCHGCTQASSIRGFDTTTRLISRGDIKSGGVPKDGIPALTDPEFIGAEAADFLKPDDLVIGLYLDGVAKAYPLRIL
ncbi:MAG: DUF3179 domain-containing (seleno)protein, partial [Verrucomicrobiota bacterium]